MVKIETEWNLNGASLSFKSDYVDYDDDHYALEFPKGVTEKICKLFKIKTLEGKKINVRLYYE